MNKLMLLLLFAGCATAPATRSPTVTEVRSDVQLCVAGASLKEGQEIQLRRRVCRPLDPKRPVQICGSEPTGAARVVQVLDAGCATVQLASGVVALPGDEVVAR